MAKLQLLHISLAYLLLLWLSSVRAVKCPAYCRCFRVVDSLEVHCSNSLINYPDVEGMQVEYLDLSHNGFTRFPTYLADIESLQYLDLSNNKISYIDAEALSGFRSLRTLLLANNSIQSWADINAKSAFRQAVSLQVLNLSGNKLSSFSNENADNVLVSESLLKLELEDCGITQAGGDVLINALPNLQILNLSNNSITTMPAMPSRTLRILHLENCGLQRLSTALLGSLPALESLNLRWNTAIQLSTKVAEVLSSQSLTELDLSFCNIDEVYLAELPNLGKLSLKGNMLRTISSQLLQNNTQLTELDISENSISVIQANAFRKLKRLNKLDASFNEIALLDRYIFRYNDNLATLNLSHNYIEKLNKLVSNSLRDINLSSCTIIDISVDALTGLSALKTLNLSNNIIKDIPSNMNSETLSNLDLAHNKLSILRNNTLAGFPELSSLRLNDNRFTTPFSIKYFRSNKYLHEIWLGDNPWICNCNDASFIEFYDYLTAVPKKLKDLNSARCASPSFYYGQTWEMVCSYAWQQNMRSSSAEKVWTLILILVLVFIGLAFVIHCLQNYIKSRKQQRNRREYRSNQEEMSQIRRHNQRILEEAGTPNAPDSFQMNLPSYEDALLMPKLERPTKSMLDLSASARARRKLQRMHTDPEEANAAEQEDADLILDPIHRFRSEAMLASRDAERTAYIGPTRRTGFIPYNNSGNRLYCIDDSRFPAAHYKSQNLQSAEKIGNFQSYENSPYTKRKNKIAEIPPFKRAFLRTNSVEYLTDPEFDAQSKPASPFARRKPKTPLAEQQLEQPLYSNIVDNSPLLAHAVEDHFGQNAKHKSQSNSTDGSDFQVVIEPDMASLPDSQDARNSASSASSASKCDNDLMQGKRKVRKNSANRRVSGNFSAAAAAAADDNSSSDREPIVVVHKPMKETLF